MRTFFLEKKGHRVWVQCIEAQNPKGTIVWTSGSGEYRTVGMEGTNDVAEWVLEQGLNFVTFDKYGCGESDGKWSEVTFQNLINDLVAVSNCAKRRFGVPVIAMGHSEGSLLSTEASLLTEAISGLILRVPSHQKLSERLKMQVGDSQWERWSETVNSFKSKNKIDGFCLDHPNTYWVSRLQRDLTGNLLEKVKVPTLVLNGVEDNFTPPHAYEKIHSVVNRRNDFLSMAIAITGVGHSLREKEQEWKDSKAAFEIKSWFDRVFTE